MSDYISMAVRGIKKEVIEESWLTKVRETLIREGWELLQGQERGRQGKCQEVRNSLQGDLEVKR
jgi:hypothetical protein